MAVGSAGPPETVGDGEPGRLQVMAPGHPAADHFEPVQAGEDLFADAPAGDAALDAPVQEGVAAGMRLGGDAGVAFPAVEDLGGIEMYRGVRAVSPVLLNVAPVEVQEVGYRVEVEQDVRAVVGADLDSGGDEGGDPDPCRSASATPLTWLWSVIASPIPPRRAASFNASRTRVGGESECRVWK